MANKKDALGDRMKAYENISRNYFKVTSTYQGGALGS